MSFYGSPIASIEAALQGSRPSLAAYQQWYALRDELAPFIGERAVSLFGYAISDETGSLVCSVHFRRILVDSGEDPDAPQVTEAEQLLIDWGRAIARDPGKITAAMRSRLEAAFHPELRVLLVAFAGQLIATNLFAIVGRVPLEEALNDYRRPGDERTAG